MAARPRATLNAPVLNRNQHGTLPSSAPVKPRAARVAVAVADVGNRVKRHPRRRRKIWFVLYRASALKP